MYSRIYVYTTIQATPAVIVILFLYLYFIFVSRFDLTFSSACSHHRLLFCKGIVGKEHGKHRSSLLLAENFS